MMAMGAWEMILIFGLLAGGGSLDIVSTLPAKEYFKSRDIEVSADKLMELAVQTPDSGKKQFAQLMALSHLAAEPDLLKNSPKFADHRKTLDEIASGKKAADATGFAADYAKKVQRAITGEKPPPPVKRAWKDNLKFLPEKADMIGFIDMGTGTASTQKFLMIGQMLQVMPKEAQEQMWSAVEKFGNVQVESVGVALSFDAASGQVSEFFVRLTGRGNSDWLLAEMNELKELKDKARTDANGDKIRIFGPTRNGGDDPMMAVIGNREIVLAGAPMTFDGKQRVKRSQRSNEEIMEQVLALRGKGKGPHEGNLKADFAKVPADAVSLLVGNVPPDKGGAPFPMPSKIVAFGKQFAGSIDLQVTGVMADDEAAKGLIAQIGKFREMGLQELKKVQGQPLPIPGMNINGVINLLESVQLEAEGNEAKLRALVPEEMMSMLMGGFMIPFQMRAAAPPPPVPQPAPPKKVEVEKK